MNAPTPSSEPLPAPLVQEGMMSVGEGHELFYEISGDPEGIPTVYLHGGPGGRLSTGYRRNSPADRFRLIGLAQRGAGRSTPSAGDPGPVELATNTTAHLVDDLERLREHLDVDAWVVQGASWGSTLALAYAQAHPENTLGVLLFAVTSTSRREVDWITEGIGAVFPEAWDRFASFAEVHGEFDRHATGPERVRLVEAYRRMLSSDEPELVDAAARAWCAWEDEHIRIGTGSLAPAAGPSMQTTQEQHQQRLFARLVTHYWAHDGFVADWAVGWGAAPGSGLLGGMDRLADIPGMLIHGRRDVSGPALTAWELHRAWPGSELIIVEDEGHGGPAMVQHWREGMARLAEQIGAVQ